MPGPEAGPARSRALRSRALLALAGLAVLVHVPSLANGFAWDDPRHVVANERLHGLDRLGEVVTSPYLADTHPMRSPYRPLTSASYAVSWAMGDGDPLPFHVFNVAAHAAATVLTFALLLALGAPALPAAAGTALFAVHPVHVEAVANVVGRGDVLMTVGVLAAAVCYLRRDLPGWSRVAGVLLGCVLAVGAKENGIVVPGLLVLLELFRGMPRSTGRVVPERPGATGAGAEGRAGVADRSGTTPATALPPLPVRLRREAPLLVGAAAVAAAYLAARWAVLGTLTTVDIAPYVAVLPDSLRITTAVANLSEVARLLVFPRDLVVDYAPAVIVPASWGDARFWAGVTVAAGAAVLAWVSARRGAGWVALAVAWVAVALFPVSNLVVRVPIWLAERTLYLPSVGVALAAVGIWEAVRTGTDLRARRAVVAAAAVLVVLGGWRSWDRSGTWRDTETVLATLVEEHPESFRSQWWLARELLARGVEDRALARYREAVAINPNDAFITLDFARALILTGRPAEAERIVRAIPSGLDASRSVYLAQALIEQGRPEEALEVVREGLERFPGDTRLRDQEKLLESGS